MKTHIPEVPVQDTSHVLICHINQCHLVLRCELCNMQDMGTRQTDLVTLLMDECHPATFVATTIAIRKSSSLIVAVGAIAKPVSMKDGNETAN